MSRPTVYDPLIINRVKQYLEDNVHQTYLDVGLMAKALQDRYPEYSRRKLVPFRMLVEQAYTTIRDSLLKDKDNLAPSDNSDGSDLEMMDESTAAGTLNNMLTGLYSKQKNAVDKANNEAIDISSDESGTENFANGKTKLKVKHLSELTIKKAGGDNKSIPIPNSSKKDQSTKGNAPGEKRSEVHTIILEASNNKKRKVQSRSPSPKGNNRQIDKSGIDSASSSSSFHQQTSNQQNQAHRVLGGYSQIPHFPSRGGQLRARRFKKEVQPQKSRQSFQDIGGMDKILKELCELLMHIKQPDIYFVLGLMPPRGVLLHGPPGCGKTLLAHAIAGQMGIPLIEVAATELIAGVSGESEERIRDVFEQATTCAPCLLFIDEIDAISSNRLNAQKDMERRIVSQLISSLDFLKATENGQSVLVVGATTRPDALDPALRRVGRFDHEIAIGIPSRRDRREILSIICDGLSIEQKFEYDKIAELTPGYVGADLLALVSRAATIAVKRKCAEQIREFQAKRKQNITIVDLVEETVVDEDSIKKNASEKADIDQQSQEKGKNSVVIEGTDKTGENIDVEVTPGKASQSISEKVEDANESVNGTTTAEIEETEQMEIDREANESEKKVKDSKAEISESFFDETENSSKVMEGKNSEPTLFEMLNWLDKSNYDCTIGDFCITFADFLEAVKVVQPSAKREGFITIPDVTWDDIGSLQDIREELKLSVLAPVKFPEKLEKLGLSAPSGILLCGPPGCGKTLLAKAVANEAGINFISVKGPELMNMYVGESERAVRACFQRARNSTPCVIFFDEFDSLCPKRSENNDSGSGTRIVNQLLTEMDGVEERKGVYVLAATNRPDIIDPAILRPGRLDTILYVGLPQENDRLEILNALTKNRTKPVLADDVDFEELAQNTNGYTGADLAGLVRQASMLALKESINFETEIDNLLVNRYHFEEAIKLLRPSVTPQDRKVYDKLREKYAAPRSLILSEDKI